MQKRQKGNSRWYERAYALTDWDDIKLDGFFNSETFDTHPAWYKNVLMGLLSQAMPAIPVKQLRSISPNKVGRFWGQKFATLFAFGGKSGMAQNPEKMQAAIDAWEKRTNQPGAVDTIRQMKMIKGWLQFGADSCEGNERAMLESFKLALGQPNHQEAVEFFKGFATGLSKVGIKGASLAGATVATPIYSMMLTHWHEVDRLPSVPKLREFLVSKGMDEQVVGDISRLRRLCTRIGYAPGKRGRPRK